MPNTPLLGLIIGLIVSGVVLKLVVALIRAPGDIANRTARHTLEEAIRAQANFSIGWFTLLDHHTALAIDPSRKWIGLAEKTAGAPRVRIMAHTALRRAEAGVGSVKLHFDAAPAFERNIRSRDTVSAMVNALN